MSQLNKTNFGAKYGTSGSEFPDNTTGLITELIMRTFGQDGLDSFLNNVDDLQKKTTAAGTNTYTLTGGIASYADGYMVIVKFTNASSGACTLNVNSKGDKKIYVNATTQATTGDILANKVYLLIYDSALDSAAGGFHLIGGAGSGGATPGIDDVLAEAQALTDDRTVDVSTHTLIENATGPTDYSQRVLDNGSAAMTHSTNDNTQQCIVSVEDGILITDTRTNRGLQGQANYSANIQANDFVQKNYVDSAVAGLKWKQSVRVSTTVAGTLSTSFENGDTVDGIVLATGNRILIKNQASQTENGIYTVNASGAPTRSTDADSATELESATVSVEEGTSNANTTWIQTTDSVNLGVSNIVFTQFGSSSPDASETVKGIIEIATQAEVTTGTDDVRAVTPLKLAVATRGIQDVPIMAAAMWPTETNGCNPLSRVAMTTSLVNLQVLEFPNSGQTFAQVIFVLPRKYNNGTITAAVHWKPAATGSGDVRWGIQLGSYRNDDALTVALGTEIANTDTYIALNDLHITSEFNAITPAGTVADGNLMVLQINRDSAAGADTLDVGAQLIGIVLRVTTDASIDE